MAAAGVAALAAGVIGCASDAVRTTETLPPLEGAPSTLPLPGLVTTTVPATGATADPTAPTVATAPGATTTASPGGVTWGGWPYYEVPQLGSEPVRGSGCGADGSIGDTVPDGVWNVIVGDGTGADRFWSGGTIQLDLRCVYAGDAGLAQWNTVCGAAPGADACLSQSPDWFVVNANSRLRTMPVAADVAYGVGALGSPPCAGVSVDPLSPDAPWRFMDSWVVVSGGVVTTVVAACPAG